MPVIYKAFVAGAGSDHAAKILDALGATA